jgi:predicted nucleotide-binding protein (sugar kinase/HSP70/actin superfamily)
MLCIELDVNDFRHLNCYNHGNAASSKGKKRKRKEKAQIAIIEVPYNLKKG